MAGSGYAVIGSDSLIGARLFQRLHAANLPVVGTSRRTPASGTIPLDLAAGPLAEAPAADCAVFCASVTSMQACEQDPAATRRVNVTHTLSSIRRLVERGGFVVFLSSSAVFDGERAFPPEDAPTSPTTEYARQKAEAEAGLRELAGRVAIVRLTKVLAPSVPVVRRFLDALAGGSALEAFSDLALSPVSLDYVVDGLLAIARQRAAGTFHLSGEGQLTYVELAMQLAQRAGLDGSRVRAVSSAERGSPALYRPRHAALGMPVTQRTLGLQPQPAGEALAALLS